MTLDTFSPFFSISYNINLPVRWRILSIGFSLSWIFIISNYLPEIHKFFIVLLPSPYYLATARLNPIKNWQSEPESGKSNGKS